MGNRGRGISCALIAGLLLISGCSSPAPVPTPSQMATAEWTPGDPKLLDTLPTADTWTIISTLPEDTDQGTMPSGEQVAPKSKKGALIYDEVDGHPVAVLPQVQYQGDSFYPVIDRQDEWVHILLSSRRGLPSTAGKDGVNGATGWVRLDDVTVDNNPYAITANLKTLKMTLTKDGKEVVTTGIGIGVPATPTPVTRTFVMSIYHDPKVTYSKYIIALGTHSPTLDTFGGGPAPTAIHAYSTSAGVVSNGCLRIPPSMLDSFREVPLGTPVLILEG